MFDIFNLVLNIFVMLSGSEQHNDQETKKLIVTLTVIFLVLGIAYLLWQSFFVIPSE